MKIAPYRERLRVLLILYFFSEEYVEPSEPTLAKVFYWEVKIQKIDFLLRYPSYLCFELLRLHQETGVPSSTDVQQIVSDIFAKGEPDLRTDEMKRFFFGAYQDLDDIIGFLKSVGLVEFRKQTSMGLKDIRKAYFLTQDGIQRIERGLANVPSASWYFDRCQLIKRYFADASGTQLKNRQYAIEEYRETPLGDYIQDIEAMVRTEYFTLFKTQL
ncbi:MAG TPA: hypothetical protein VFO93_05815 [Hymenobacter sp.]|uniref:hypothetical protein n=1 Tax=Hymenobacter sp. TaxID=1898978 RepID=UPI002D7FE6A2|nr:hypothetical protein [Hymenobacter sp.]HET9503035.1 hypothetical protein [Hymenobacter sp.]